MRCGYEFRRLVRQAQAMPNDDRAHDASHGPPRVVVVGGGLAGDHATRAPARTMDSAAEIVLISPTDCFRYLPLLPEVAAGILEPRRISVALADALPTGVRIMAGEVDDIDLTGRRVRWVDPEGGRRDTSYDPPHLRGGRGRLHRHRARRAGAAVHRPAGPEPGLAEGAAVGAARSGPVGRGPARHVLAGGAAGPARVPADAPTADARGARASRVPRPSALTVRADRAPVRGAACRDR